jgi:hypothetical protein
MNLEVSRKKGSLPVFMYLLSHYFLEEVKKSKDDAGQPVSGPKFEVRISPIGS